MAVVADGAGSAARSDEGARTVCGAYLEFCGLALEWLHNQTDYLDGKFPGSLLHDLRENLEGLATNDKQAVGAYACTFLGVLVTKVSTLFFQIGDGAIAYRLSEADSWHLAIDAQRGEFVNETVFVTRIDAASYLRAVKIESPVLEFAMMSDGVESLAIRTASKEPHAAFFEHALRGLREEKEIGPSSAHSEWIRNFLNSAAVNSRTDDDKTLILATRLRHPAVL
jgi:hypothetical protein